MAYRTVMVSTSVEQCMGVGLVNSCIPAYEAGWVAINTFFYSRVPLVEWPELVCPKELVIVITSPTPRA